MMTNERTAAGSLRGWLLAAALVTFFAVVMGNVVRVSASGAVCADWPTCYGQAAWPQDTAAQLHMLHRLVSGAGALLALAAAVLAVRRGAARVVRGLAALGAGVMLVQAAWGAWVALRPETEFLAGVHLGLALTALGALSAAALAAYRFHHDPQQADRLRFASPFARLTLAVLAVVGVLMVSGAWVVSLDAGASCTGWPLCAGGLPTDGLGWLALAHRALTLVSAVGMVALVVRAWRGQRSQQVTLTAATAAFTLFAGQVLIGAVKVSRGFSADLVGLHSASAAGVWAALALTAAAAGLAGRRSEDERAEATEPLLFRARLRDFFTLSKPLIVALLLVTTYAGMVMGARAIPGWEVTLWTMLGGALAAAGSSAINQYIDRDIDGSMQRTARRPLPARRLTPGEGLAYGVAANLISFFLLAGFVNLTAALLSLAGMVYYVLIYSLWLKRLTVQNIVIGGGAGAIPPLVGWAAATGSLTFPSLFLFAIIFLWTPPHFWALALVRRNDYARAGVPMMPVIRGEKTTRLQIFIYTLELVAVTLLMPLLNLTGSVFLISAAVLGLWLIGAAWRVLRVGGNKVAWKMYRYSSMYLMFIFAALVVDVLV